MLKLPWAQCLRFIYLILRYNLDEFLLHTAYFRHLYFLRWCNPYYILFNRFMPRGQRLSLALQKAGPLFVKIGQMLSTRQDILPKNIIDHLVTLQDQVPAFSSKIAMQRIKSSLKSRSIDFSHIESMPLASASIAQVHAATLVGGKAVVIKILRPKIDLLLQRDIGFLRWGATILERWLQKRNFSGQNKPISLRKIVDEIENTLKQEINLINEAAHAEQLKENAQAKRETTLFIPKIYWEYSTETILTMERIFGVPIMDLNTLNAAGVNLHALAKKCVTILFTQIFHDNYFHADLHPGNIFINITRADNPVIELVDFGIVGSLSLEDRRYIAENMTALIDKDYRKVARLHHESGWIPAYVPEIAFAYAIKTVCDPILNKALKDISLAQLLLGLIQAAKRYEIQLQPQLLLLQKTLLNIESLCRHLDPNFNIWEVTQPILKDWLCTQIGPKAIIHFLQQRLPRLIRKLILSEEKT